MASKIREKIMLLSQGKTKAGKSTGYFYTTSINKRNMTNKGHGKLTLEKFDPLAWNEEKKRLGLKVEVKQKKIPK